MNKFLLYGHGGSYNHGAEAIVKCTIRRLREKYTDAYVILSCNFPEQDREFGVDADEIIGPDIAAWEAEKVAPAEQKETLAQEMYAEALSRITPNTTLLSVGGDNFCYPTWHRLAVFQKEAVRLGAKSVLWSTSVEPSAITPAMLEILNTYDEITARESLTYESLKMNDVHTALKLTKDVAFELEPEPVTLPEGFVKGNFIGVNFSPLIVRAETSPGIIMHNFLNLSLSVLTETNFNIALIPHVVMPMDNDYDVLAALYALLPNSLKSRIWLVSNKLSAAQYKYIISQCAAFTASRTHASIAAYSTGVPCLAIGYSVKAAGIARDLAMNEYVVKVFDIRAEDDLLIRFRHMLQLIGL
jgi:colanic acid/amylovoran biosynthesis protein